MRRIEPAEGHESVWDYPRPPRVEALDRRVRIEHGGEVIAESTSAMRVLETSHPPGIYVPPSDVVMDLLTPSPTSSWCEFKGRAVYWSLHIAGATIADVAWSYPDPTPGFEGIADHLSFYPGRVDRCFIGDERVRPQEGAFYGGWITDDVVGPFKGGAGTLGW